MLLMRRAVRPGAVFWAKIKLGPMVVLFMHNALVWCGMRWCGVVEYDGANGGFIHTAGTL